MKKKFSMVIVSLMVVCAVFSNAGAGKASAADSTELYTLKQFAQTTDITLSSETPIGQIIKDRFNIEFEYIPVTGNLREMQALMLASGDYPELMNVQRLDLLKQYISAGVAQPLDEYLADMPNFKERYAVQIPYWRLSGPDGKLYNWDSEVPQEPRMRVEVLDIAIRTDVLEQAGYPKLLSSDDYVDFCISSDDVEHIFHRFFSLHTHWVTALEVPFLDVGDHDILEEIVPTTFATPLL